jgi:hypothetical protein
MALAFRGPEEAETRVHPNEGGPNPQRLLISGDPRLEGEPGRPAPTLMAGSISRIRCFPGNYGSAPGLLFPTQGRPRLNSPEGTIA